MKLGKNKKEMRILLAIGGLLHDLGKVVIRSKWEELKGPTQQIGKEFHYKDKFKYTHAFYTYKILEEKIAHPVILAGAYHHLPEKAEDGLRLYARIYQFADHYSSSERSKKEKELEEDLLRPVFQSISFKDNFYAEDKYFYNLKPLSLEEKILFPYEFIDEDKNVLYKNLWEEFIKEFEFSIQNFDRETDLIYKEKLLSVIYHLCYKYFWCVPASTYDPERKEKHYPDISLFDHSRITGAISACLWSEGNLEVLQSSKNPSPEDLKIVFIKGDVSGIQEFLYDVRNLKGVAKRLRGRSVFLAFLSELIGRALLDELEYPFINILFSGGGHFEAIVGYEKGIEERLNKFEKNIEKYLLREFYGKLGLIIAYKIKSLEVLKNYNDIIKEIHKKIDEKKKKKFASLLEENIDLEKLINEKIESLEGKILCPSCRVAVLEEKEVTEEEDNVCSWCRDFRDVGKIIPKAKYVVFTKDQLDGFNGFYLGNKEQKIGGIYFLSELKEISGKYLSTSFVYLLNNTNFLTNKTDGFKFLANVVPLGKDKEIKSFEELVEDLEGDKKLAFARADVDNLGFIFMKGLGEDYSISRIATLSRNLDLFFCGYLNTLFKEKEEFKEKIYILYAGGDDLFMIGPWETILKAIKEVREKFKRYTCYNENIDLSSGVYTSRANYPIRFAAEHAGKAEENAKERKPAISAFNEVLRWEKFVEAVNESGDMADFLEEKNIGRSLFYKFYQLLCYYKEKDKNNDPMKYKFYPMFYYYLHRNVKKEDCNKILNFFLEKEKDYAVREDAIFKAKYVIMKTRK